MPPHVFALRSAVGVPPRWYARGLPEFGHLPGDKPRRVIEDEETAVALLAYDEERDGPRMFRHLSPDQLEEALGTAKEAVEPIEKGRYDDVLDLLLFAERELFGSRITVIQAIDRRNREVIDQRTQNEADKDALTPDDIVTVG